MSWNNFRFGRQAWAVRFAAVLALASAGFGQDGGPAKPEAGEAETPHTNPDAMPEAVEIAPAATPVVAPVVAPAQPAAELAPRFELRVASIKRLLSEAKRSRAGGLLQHLMQMALAQTQESVRSLDGLPVTSFTEKLAEWPDTSLTALIFAPDLRGKSRWAVMLDLPPVQVREALESLLAAESFKDAIEGLRCIAGENGAAEIRIADDSFAYLLPTPQGATLIASHVELAELVGAREDSHTSRGKDSRAGSVNDPADISSPPQSRRTAAAGGGAPEASRASEDLAELVGARKDSRTSESARKDSRTSVTGVDSRTSDTGVSNAGVSDTGVSNTTPDLITCRLNLTGTEKDSGATAFSSFAVITGVEYAGRVSESGEWQESVKVLWPTIAGMGAKAFFDRVKQTFFVPESALGAMAANVTIVPGMLEAMAGFGPQMIMEGGQMTMIGDAPGALGPIVSHVESEFCMTVLPGTGFIPAPDIVVQTRARKPDEMMKSLQAAAKKLNEQFVERDLPPPWREATVWDKPVLWSEGASYPGSFLPFIMRPVLFVTEEKDAKDRERSFLVIAWTTTSPEGFVERWRKLPRNDKRKFLPTEGKTDGQMWINWQGAYARFSPYANVLLGAASQGQLLPSFDEVRAQLTDGLVTANLGYAGLTLSHAGPLPIGAMVVPSLGTVAAAPDEFGSSDLARERLATQRLEVLYHHSKLFHKDIGRWPAEVAELDGYVDFSGHPELLELNLSSSKRWRDWLDEIFKDEEKKADKEDDVEDLTAEINDRLYVIHWGKERWTLGLAPGTLEHLENLYIDQDGKVHRVEKNGKEPEQKPAATEQISTKEPSEPEVVVETAMTKQ